MLNPHGRARAWLGLFALSLLFLVVSVASFTALGAVLPDMVTSLGWRWTGAGLGYTVLGASCGLASFAPAVTIRFLGARLTVVLGAGVMAMGLLCLAEVHSLIVYWLGAGLMGVGFALASVIPATFVLAGAFSRPSHALGTYFTAGALGGSGGPFLYGALRDLHTDWRTYWLVCAAAVFLAGALAALAIVDRPALVDDFDYPAANLSSAAFTPLQALATPQFWIIAAAYTTFLLCETSVNGMSVAHLIHRGVSPSAARGMLGLQALVNMLARAGGGMIGDRVRPRFLVIGALGLMAVGILALAHARGYPLMLTYVVGVGVGYGVSYLATILLLINYFGRRFNLEIFSTLCLVSTVAAAGPWLAGAVHDRFGGFEMAFYGFAGLAVAAFVLVAFMRPPTLPHTRLIAESSLP